MHIFLDNFHQGGKYSAQIATYQEEFTREGEITDLKYLSTSSLQTDHLNFDRSSGCGRIKREKVNIAQVNALFM